MEAHYGKVKTFWYDFVIGIKWAGCFIRHMANTSTVYAKSFYKRMPCSFLDTQVFPIARLACLKLDTNMQQIQIQQ